jgi:FixJ family two-component response regulator
VPNKPIIYIVDDDEGMRKALSLLMKTKGYHSHACASAYEFLDAYERSRPGCLLLDVRMPEMSGLELQKRLVTEAIKISTIIMTGHADVGMAVQAMKNGARDFIEKPFRNQDILEVIQNCLADETKKDMVRERHEQDLKALAQLTPREREVMKLLAEGKVNKQVATELDISVRTAEVHRANVMRKLHVKTLPALVRLVQLESDVENSSNLPD